MNKTLAVKIKEIFSRNLNIPIATIDGDIQRSIESRWDSVTHLKIISEIEVEFGIEFSIEQLRSCNSLYEIIEMVNLVSQGRDN